MTRLETIIALSFSPILIKLGEAAIKVGGEASVKD